MNARALPAAASWTAGHAAPWQDFLEQLVDAAEDAVQLEPCGRLERVAGLVLQASGLRVPVGTVCHVRQDGQPALSAEVVGFDGDRAFLMPTGPVLGLASGARVEPLRLPPTVPTWGEAARPRSRSPQALQLPMGGGLLGRVVDAHGEPLDHGGPLQDVNPASLVRPPSMPWTASPSANRWTPAFGPSTPC